MANPLEGTCSVRKRRTHREQDYLKSEQGEAAKKATETQPRAVASDNSAGKAQADALVSPPW